MGDKEAALKDLKLYFGCNYTLMNIECQNRVEGILERLVKALEEGATKKDINDIFSDYISAWQPDRTHG